MKRGLRSEKAKARRRILRTQKTRLARIQARRKRSKAPLRGQERTFQTKLPHGLKYKVATLNTRTAVEPGQREAIELWMKQRRIDILLLQETKVRTDTRVHRGDFVWYFSGSNKASQTKSGFEAGVAVVLRNKLSKHVIDINPISDRLMTVTLQATMPVTFSNT